VALNFREDPFDRRYHHVCFLPASCWEESAMTKLKLLVAAVVLSSAATGPALAQPVVDSPGKCAQQYPNANCQDFGPGNPYTGGYGRGERPMATHRIVKENRKSRQKGH
jgi:hypothetical protein